MPLCLDSCPAATLQRYEAHDVPDEGIARGLPSRRALAGFQSVSERYALYRGRATRFVSSSPEPCAFAVVNECPNPGGAEEEMSS